MHLISGPNLLLCKKNCSAFSFKPGEQNRKTNTPEKSLNQTVHIETNKQIIETNKNKIYVIKTKKKNKLDKKNSKGKKSVNKASKQESVIGSGLRFLNYFHNYSKDVVPLDNSFDFSNPEDSFASKAMLTWFNDFAKLGHLHGDHSYSVYTKACKLVQGMPVGDLHQETLKNYLLLEKQFEKTYGMYTWPKSGCTYW